METKSNDKNFLKNKFLEKILNLQNKIEKCHELSGTLEFILELSKTADTFNEVPIERIKSFQIESALTRINFATKELVKKLDYIKRNLIQQKLINNFFVSEASAYQEF